MCCPRVAYNPLELLGISVELGLIASPLTDFAILVTMVITDYLMRGSWHSVFSEFALIDITV